MMRITKIILIFLMILLSIGTVTYLLTNKDPAEPTVGPTPTQQESPQAVVIEGVIVCLPHKDTSGPQTMECANGLQTEDDVYYALRDTTSDDSLLGSLQTGQEV